MADVVIPYVRDITFEYGKVDQVSPLIRRVVCNNPGPFTFKGTGTYIIGKGEGVWSFVHIEDASAATLAALRCAPGAYNIVDDDPSEQRIWLPAFARACGAPEPPQATEQQALAKSGADSVYYATRLRGASNEKAKRELNFRPRPLVWL